MNSGVSSLKIVALLLWIAGLAGAIGYTIYFENKPGVAQPAPARWPQASSINRTDGAYTLLVFLHPGCGCSKATYQELVKVLAEPHEKMEAYAVVASYPEDENSELMQSIVSNREIRLVRDSAAKEQKLFGAGTSGLTILYDPLGKLVFQGGITSRRGHVGDNKGSDAVRAILAGKPTDVSQTFVFGCGL